MDDRDTIFAHQAEAVRRLARHFEKVTVLTGVIGEASVPANVEVFSSHWTPGSSFKNIVFFYKSALAIFRKSYRPVVFSHMTDVQCALISPITKIFRIKHCLWYAHKSRSKYLSWSYFFVDRVLTSTHGSFPFQGRKVRVIGQAIDPELFQWKPASQKPLTRLIHVGRFDPSKNAEMILSAVSKAREGFPNLELTFIGSPSSVKHDAYHSKFLNKIRVDSEYSWVKLLDSVPRSELPNYLSNKDIFIHAFEGSLDKTLIEATFTGLPVVTINREYIFQFGSWGRGRHPS